MFKIAIVVEGQKHDNVIAEIEDIEVGFIPRLGDEISVLEGPESFWNTKEYSDSAIVTNVYYHVFGRPNVTITCKAISTMHVRN